MSNSNGRLIAIDGNSLMYRAFFALPNMSAKTGEPTGALYGFINMLLKLLQYKPDYLVVAFDMAGGTFRHDEYPEYKAGRKAMPDELHIQMPMVRELLKEMGIAVCRCEHFEADDIIGTFARLAGEQGVSSLLVTGDRDALQLIDGKTHVLMTKKGISETVEYDESMLFEQYGLTPDRMRDLKGLMGDGSDNLPGIPGVGEKTALKLLEKYGTLENALANADKEKGALKAKLEDENNAQLARMCYRLGTIDVHAPVDLTLEECRFAPDKMAGAIPSMMRLELRSLIDRLPAGEAPEVKAPVEVKTVRIDNEHDLNELAAKLSYEASVGVYVKDAFYIACTQTEQCEVVLGATLLDSGLSEEQVYCAFKPVFENVNIKKSVFDVKRLMHMLSRFNITLAGECFDAMIADYLLHAIHPAPNLETLEGEHLQNPKAGAAGLIRLTHELTSELESKGMTRLYEEIELPLAYVLFDMERAGFRVDEEMLVRLGTQFSQRLGELSEKIFELAGEQFNILSPKQLSTVLFEKLGLPPQKKTKSGYSTDSEVLETLTGMHGIVAPVIEYRFLSKLKSTFVDAMLTQAKADKGRIHTSFNQNVTATGRISSTEPNLQNIPVRTQLGREIRRAFIASEGNLLVGADYSQIELRLLAHMSGDENMISAFNSGADIHARTASEVFSVPLDEVTSAQRSAAKAVNFGIVYGISDYGLAKNIGVTRASAGDYIRMYLHRYPGVKRYMDESVEQGRTRGYVETLMGRRRELPEIKSSNFNTRSFGERVAMNMPIQGTAADIIKLAMVRVHERLRSEGLKAKLILQVHDELIIDTPEDEVECTKEILKDCMTNAMNLSVKLISDVKSGKSWYETK